MESNLSYTSIDCPTIASMYREEVESPVSVLANGLTAFAFPDTENKTSPLDRSQSAPLIRPQLSVDIPPPTSARKLFSTSSPFRSICKRTMSFESLTSPSETVIRPRPRRIRSATKPTTTARFKTEGRARPYPLTQPTTPSSSSGRGFQSSPTPETETYKPKLPRVSSDLCGVHTISCDTVADLVMGKHSDDFDKIIIVDCRFDYEYKGGHIKGSVNILSQEEIESAFLENPESLAGNRTAIVFHCEFSKNRGPRACKYLRERDRKIHGLEYFPQLFYPELYVMTGGYKQFFSKYPELCEPQGYISMKDSRFLDIQRVCWKVWKASKKELSRSPGL